MRIEVLVFLVLACALGVALFFLFIKKENITDKLSEDMKSRKKAQSTNDYVKYTGEPEQQDTKEYIEIINKDVIDIFRHEGDM